MKCPEFEILLEYCDGRIAGPAAQLVAAHLAKGCKRCVEDVGWYERVRTIAASDDCEEPPAWVLKRALRLFENHAKTAMNHFGRVFAALVFDSFARPIPAGVRLVETRNRQLLYRAGAYNIDLQISFSEPSAADLIGQILRENESGFGSVAELKVQLIREGQPICATVTNATGEFTISHLAHHAYELSIETKEGVIVLGLLPVSPDEP